MNKCSPVETRDSMVLVRELANAGVRFVPIPALNDEDHNDLVKELDRKLDQMLGSDKEA